MGLINDVLLGHMHAIFHKKKKKRASIFLGAIHPNFPR